MNIVLQQIALYVLLPLSIIYVAICLFLYFFQEKIIFRPEALPLDHEFNFPIPFEELNFHPKPGVVINAVKFKVSQPRGIVYYLHGNSGSLQSWGSVAKIFVDKNYEVLLIDFRTFGKSSGIISQRGLYNDANFIYDALRRQYKEEKIILYGRSIGSGIASFVAARHRPKALILEAPYYSFKDLASYYYPWLPLSLLLRYNLRTDKHVAATSCPIYIFHGTNDKIVYHGSTEKLTRLLKPGDKVFSIEGGTHNDLELWAEYSDNILSILESEELQ